MSGINYDLKKIRAFAFDVDGVISPSTIPIDAEGEPQRMVNVKDGYALQLATRLGYKFAVITGGNIPSIQRRCEALGINDVYPGTADKETVFRQWIEKEGLSADEVLYMGDDIPDLKCMRIAGVACAPYDASHEARETASYISKFSGGYGCVRDVIEQVLRAHGNWMKDDAAFHW